MHKSMGEPMHVMFEKSGKGHFPGVVTIAERKRQLDDDLKSRIYAMKNKIENIRAELENEKKLLAMERLEILGCPIKQGNGISSSGTENYSIQPSAALLNRTNTKYPTTGIRLRNKMLLTESPKQHLRMIEQKCDDEVIKLQTYIDSIKHLRRHWRNMSFDRESKVASRHNKNRTDSIHL